MKTTTVFLISVLVIMAVMVTTKPVSASEGEPYLTKVFTLDKPGSLQVRTSGGSIDVSAHQGNKVRVEMYVRKGGRSIPPGEAKDLLEEFRIDISQSSSTVNATAERRERSWFNSGSNVSISFTVYVPENMACNLNTSGGSIRLKGVNGRQEMKTSGGSLTLSQIKGDTEARTSGGSINIEKYAGTLRANTSGGSINLRDSRGDLVVHTSGGSIKLDNVVGSIEASTSGGGIHANIQTLEKQLRLKTSGGSITAVIPKGLGLDLDLRGGRVNTKLVNFSGEIEKDRIRGSMNGGGIPVVMYTSGGSVNVEYQ